MKACLFKFSDKYDVLLGYKTMKEHNMTINFKTNHLESDTIVIPIKADVMIPLKTRLNIIEISIVSNKKGNFRIRLEQK